MEEKLLTIAAGTKLGRYEIRSKIGAGGMGEVYLAEDTQLRRRVALKILPGDIALNKDRMRRFVQEAQAAAALNHPNIAHIYEIGTDRGSSPTVSGGLGANTTSGEDIHFIAMEFIDGLTLRELIHEKQTDLPKLLRYLQHVAEGLAKAHAAGIVHRDLKPDNVMITRDGYAKILDFGLAKLVEARHPLGKTSEASSEVATAVMPQHSLPGTVMGTVGYMSPEQAQGKTREIDHRSDIFSFGCILYEAATGQKAFEGKDALDSLHKIVHAPTPQVKDINPLAPDDLQRIVRRCVMKDPEKRYQTIKDVAIELEELQQELKGAMELEQSVAHAVNSVASVGSTNQSVAGTTAPSAVSTANVEGTRPTTSAEYIVSGIKRHKTVMVLAVVAIVAAGIGLAFGLYKFLSNRRPVNQARTIIRLTNSGKVNTATISPDGKYVAYSALDESGQTSLWVRHVTSNVQIVPPAGMDVFFGGITFSPDGNYIYYIRTERNTSAGVLYEVPVLGGTSKKVLGDVSRISFSPDGKRFAFERRYTSEAQDAVMVANTDGTGEQRLAVRKHPEYFLAGVAWSPDGKTIACPMGGFTGGHYRNVAIIQVADGRQTELSSHRWQNVERLAWLADGSAVITTAKEQREREEQVWQISYPDGEAHPITSDLNTYHNVSLTADSSSLAVVLFDQTSNIWVAPYGEWNNTRQITSGKSNGAAPGDTTWTPDGRIVFGSRASGNPDLWIMGSDGRNQKQLTDDAEGQGWPSVTSDGRYVVYASGSITLQIWRMDIDGSNRKQLTQGIGSYVPHCSPDGKWVVYSTFGTNGFNLWKISIDGGEPIQITNKVADLPAVSPDGKLIACYLFDDQSKTTKLALLPFAGGDPVQMFDLPRSVDNRGGGGQAVRWTPDGRALTYIVTRGGISNIWAKPIDGSAPKQLTDFKTDRIFSFDWSRDGKQLACSRGPVESDVVLISNFR